LLEQEAKDEEFERLAKQIGYWGAYFYTRFEAFAGHEGYFETTLAPLVSGYATARMDSKVPGDALQRLAAAPGSTPRFAASIRRTGRPGGTFQPIRLPRLKEQGRNALGQFLPLKGGEVIPGSNAENVTWAAIKNKPGWRVIEGRVYARDATGQERVYDGVAISPKGHVIGLEVKSGTGKKTPEQRAFDNRVNAGNPVRGVGQHSDLEIERVIEIRK